MSVTLGVDQNAAAVITHRIVERHQQEYEDWLQEIVPAAKSYPGHSGVMIIRPIPGGALVYTIVIRFDTHTHLIDWMNSKERKALITKIQPYLVEEDHYQVQEGLDFWFTPEGSKSKYPRKWKQTLVTWSAIYPLVLGMSLLIAALERQLGITPHFSLNTLALTFIVVLLMVYVVMPRYTKLVHEWLYD